MPFTITPTTGPITPTAALTNPRYTLGTDNRRGSIVMEIDPTNRARTLGIVDAQGRGRLYASTDGMVSGNTLLRDFNVGVTNASQEVMGVRALPNGELLVSIRNAYSLDGGLFLSTGYTANPTTATWARVLPWSNSGNYASTYGLDFAPAGHVREGLVVVTEYGGQSSAGTNVDAGSSRVWVSTDYGRTWREIFNLLKTYGTKNHHMHGCAYDQYTDNILICWGDGYAGAPAVSAIAYSDTWLDATPTWKPIVGPASKADWQATLIKPMPAGVIIGSDGGPDGVWFMPRDPRGGYVLPRPVLTNPRGSCIATQAYQATPNSPVFMVWQNGQANADYVRVLMVHPRGDRIEEVYVDTVSIAPTWGACLSVVGPDARGYVYFTAQDGRSVRTAARTTLTTTATSASGGGTATDVTVADLTAIYNTAKA